MNLQEMNESYDEYTKTDDFVLEEGLKFFKKSNKLYNFANRLENKLMKLEKKSKVSPTEMSKVKALSKDAVKLADEFKVIEDDFANSKVNKKVSKEKLKRVKLKNERLLKQMKSDETKQVFKKLGIVALGLGLTVALGGTLNAFNVGKTIITASSSARVGPY